MAVVRQDPYFSQNVAKGDFNCLYDFTGDILECRAIKSWTKRLKESGQYFGTGSIK